MRARVYSNGGISTGGFTFNGGQLTGALILAGNPSDPLEAAAKQYVDSSLVNLNASNLTSGILPAGRLPVFTGDIVKPAGSSSINIAPIGITAGDYVKPTVDAKGRVTAGGVITEADLPNISWNKVSTGKPTTVEGYGITDALTTAGGTLSGFLTFNGSITGTMQAVTKQYVDVTLSSSTGIAIGDIIRKPYGTTPAGFLKCNGALVSKTTYNALYATINDRFSKNIISTNSQPWKQQYSINEVQTADISNWNTDISVLPVGLSLMSIIVTKNRVYILGGYSSSGPVSNVYHAVVNTDGSLGSWVAGTALPGTLSHSSCVVIKNRVYLFGGLTAAVASNVVYTTIINSDGTLGTWTSSTNLPGNLSHSRAIVTNSRIYLLGGWNGTSVVNTVYSTTYNSDGTIGSWSTSTSLPVGVLEASVFTTKNRVYLCGGHTTWPSPVLSSVYTASINTDGTLGTWTASASLPLGFGSSEIFVTKNRVYLLGGHNGSTQFSTVVTATINADGTVGTWGIGSSLPGALAQSRCVCLKNKLYLIGGSNTSGQSNAIYSAVISGGLNDYSKYYASDDTNYLMPGSGKPWEQQYQLNNLQTQELNGWTTTTNFPISIASSSVFVTKNRVYMIGGYNGTTTINTIYSASINADGTLGTWTTSSNFPIAIQSASVVITKNKVHIIGGLDSSGTALYSTYSANINADGTITTWSLSSNLIAVAVANAICIVTKNKVYLFGGHGTTLSAWANGQSCSINSDGSLSAWTNHVSQMPGSLPAARSRACCAVVKNRIYILGGWNGSSTYNTIFTATINSDGLVSTWTSYGTLPINISHGTVFVSNKRIYLISGSNGSSNISNIYSAIINDDGSLGAWSTNNTTIPFGLYSNTVFVTNNKIYSVGGYNGSTYVPSVYMASILGGENDYSPYYDGTIVPVEPVDQTNLFALPDLTQSEKFDTVSYIKY